MPDVARTTWFRNTLALLERTDTRRWLMILTVGSVVAATVLLPEDWSLVRRVAGGALMGVGSGFCVFMPRMIGGHDFNGR